MAYEVFKRSTVRQELPALSLVPGGRIVANAAAARILTQAGVKSVLLMWDKNTHRLALKAVPKGDKNGYAVSLSTERHSGSLRAMQFLRYIGWSAPKRESLPATWNEKERMLEVTLPKRYLALTSPAESAKDRT